MIGTVAALGLLVVNVGILAAVHAASPTTSGNETVPEEPDRCVVCATAEAEERVGGYSVCRDCEREYFGSV